MAIIGTAIPSPAETPRETVRRQFCEDIRSNFSPAARAQAEEFATTLTAEGSWPDLDYAIPTRSAWPAGRHVTRLLQLATAAADDPAQRERLLPVIHRAFAYWMKHDLQNPNWWHNEIGIPRQLGAAGILLGGDLSSEERNYLVHTVLPRSKISRTGQNRLWLAGNTLMLGLLAEQDATIQTSAEVIWSEVVISHEEGIQPDFSFHQHGAQQQFGNYGLSFANDITQWMTILRNTPWQMPAGKLEIVRGYFLEGQNRVCWRGGMDISSCGRQLYPGEQQSKFRVIARGMNLMAQLDPEEKPAYKAFATRNHSDAVNDLTGHRHFWRSDYTVHRGKELFASLKMESVRVIGGESLNSENLSGYHLAHGVLLLYRSGEEYGALLPTWDWRNLPGTTTAQKEVPRFSRSQGTTEFVGGVSSGDYGVSAMDFQRDGVSARKAWFFSGDAVYSLGTAITSTSEEVVTTINQCRLEGSVEGLRGEKIEAVPDGPVGEFTWIEHAGLRYTLLDAPSARLSTAPATGNWKRIYDTPSTPQEDVTLAAFRLQIPHGTAPQDAHYGWAVTCSGHPAAGKILSNTPALQAVALDAATYGIVFWQPGSFPSPEGESLTVSQPCVAVFTPAEKKVVLADPTQKLASIRVQIGEMVRDVSLPGGGETGSSMSAVLAQ